MRTVEGAPGVYWIPLAWGNAYLLRGRGGAALIDTGLARDRPVLVRALELAGVVPGDLTSVLLTHGHCDHAGSAAFFAKGGHGSAASVLAHRREAPYLTAPARRYGPGGWRALTRPLTAAAFAAGERLYPVERLKLARLLEDGDVVDAPGGSLRVVATPGHTAGHIAFLREHDGLLFSGDAVLSIVPIVRKPGISLAIPLLSDDMEAAMDSAVRLSHLTFSVLLPGHGTPICEAAASALSNWVQQTGRATAC